MDLVPRTTSLKYWTGVPGSLATGVRMLRNAAFAFARLQPQKLPISRFQPLVLPFLDPNADAYEKESSQYRKDHDTVETGADSNPDASREQDHRRRGQPLHLEPGFHNESRTKKAESAYDLRSQTHRIHHRPLVMLTVHPYAFDGDDSDQGGRYRYERKRFHTSRLIFVRSVESDQQSEEGAEENS
jgi:hypothetical protein